MNFYHGWGVTASSGAARSSCTVGSRTSGGRSMAELSGAELKRMLRGNAPSRLRGAEWLGPKSGDSEVRPGQGPAFGPRIQRSSVTSQTETYSLNPSGQGKARLLSPLTRSAPPLHTRQLGSSRRPMRHPEGCMPPYAEHPRTRVRTTGGLTCGVRRCEVAGSP